MHGSVRGVLFDFGGTLSKHQAPLVIQKILGDQGIPCQLDLLEKAILAAWEQDAFTAMRSEFRGYKAPGELDEYVRINRLILSHAGIHSDHTDLAHLIDEKWSDYSAAVGREAFEDVVTCLNALRESKLRMGVVSNIDSKDELRKGVADLGVEEYFLSLVASGEVGYVKPQPEIFQIASKELELTPSSLVHVGDLYATDVLGAKGAGITGILLDREDRLPSVECRRILSLEELPLMIEEL